jgi:hypothetical protein
VDADTDCGFLFCLICFEKIYFYLFIQKVISEKTVLNEPPIKWNGHPQFTGNIASKIFKPLKKWKLLLKGITKAPIKWNDSLKG